MMIPDKRDTLGAIPDRFDALLANALAQEEAKPMKRKLSTTLLVAVLLIALLTATALAVVSLSRSSQGNAVHIARQALGEKYGLTTETLGLFWQEIEQDENGWTLVFTDVSTDGEKLGIYSVVIAPDGKAEATWSHDDVDTSLWQDGNMDAPVWGQAQMMRYLADKETDWQAYLQIDWSQADFATIAEHQSHMYLFRVGDDRPDMFYYAVPGAEDTAQEQAVQTAKQAILDTYAADVDALMASEGYAEQVSFAEAEEDGTRQFLVEYVQPYPLTGHLSVQVASPSGEVLGVRWNMDKALRTLPEGPLDAYRHAVEEFMLSGALQAKSATEKAEIVQRVKDAGWEALIQPALPYVAPGAQDIAEVAALSGAKGALMDEYAFTEEGFTLFEATTSLLEIDGARRWTIDFSPLPFENWYLDMDMEKGKLGSYAVTLDASSGEVLEAAWDQAEAWDEGSYTQSTWATAPVYHGKLLPWLVQLTEGLADIAALYPAEDATIYDYSDEDIAAYDALFRGAGFPITQFNHSLPGPEDLTKEEALAIAREALLAEMPIPQALWDTMDVVIDFSIREAQTPQWGFSFRFTHEGVFVDFGVSIDARTGEVLYTNSVTGGNG